MLRPRFIFPTSDNTRQFAALQSKALVPMVDTSREGVDRVVYVPADSLPEGSVGVNGVRREFSGSVRATKTVDESYASVMTVKYTPVSTLEPVIFRCSFDAQSKPGYPVTFVRKKVGSGQYTSLDDPNKSLTSLTSSLDYELYTLNHYQDFRQPGRIHYEDSFSVSTLDELTINVCCKLADLFPYPSPFKFRLVTPSDKDNIVTELNAAADWTATRGDYIDIGRPAGGNDNDSVYQALWANYHNIGLRFGIGMAVDDFNAFMDNTARLTIGGQEGRYWYSNYATNRWQIPLDWRLYFNFNSVPFSQNVNEISGGYIDFDTVYPQWDGHFGAAGRHSFMEVFQRVTGGSFSIQTTGSVDNA